MILLLVIGVVLLVLGYALPAPPPVPLILRIIGWLFVAVAAVILVAALLNGTVATGLYLP